MDNASHYTSDSNITYVGNGYYQYRSYLPHKFGLCRKKQKWELYSQSSDSESESEVSDLSCTESIQSIHPVTGSVEDVISISSSVEEVISISSSDKDVISICSTAYSDCDDEDREIISLSCCSWTKRYRFLFVD
jgi:hypothetical protein